MENINIYNRRLAKFALHLRKIKLKKHPRYGQYDQIPLVNLVSGVLIHFEARTHAWIFDDLPMLFSEWYYNSKLQAACLLGMDEKENPVAGVFDFFQLNPEEFCHLFDIDGFQSTAIYGGKLILENTETEQIADNISDFIKWRSAEQSPN